MISVIWFLLGLGWGIPLGVVLVLKMGDKDLRQEGCEKKGAPFEQ